VTVSFFSVYWLIKITSLLIYALPLVRKTNDMYYAQVCSVMHVVDRCNHQSLNSVTSEVSFSSVITNLYGIKKISRFNVLQI